MSLVSVASAQRSVFRQSSLLTFATMAITQHFNRTLFLSVVLIAVSQFNYGFDNQAFAQTQAMDAFDKQFGEYDASIGTYALPTQFESLLNGVPFVGFAVGM